MATLFITYWGPVILQTVLSAGRNTNILAGASGNQERAGDGRDKGVEGGRVGMDPKNLDLEVAQFSADVTIAHFVF